MFDILFDGKEKTVFYLIGCNQIDDKNLESELTFMEAWKLPNEMDLYDLENNLRYRVAIPQILLNQKYQCYQMGKKIDLVFKTKGLKIPIVKDYFL